VLDLPTPLSTAIKTPADQYRWWVLRPTLQPINKTVTLFQVCQQLIQWIIWIAVRIQNQTGIVAKMTG